MSQVDKIRFAVLVDGSHLKNWQIECIQALLSDEHNSCVGFIKNKNASTFNAKRLSLGFRWLEKQSRKKFTFQSRSIDEVFSQMPVMEVKTKKEGIYTLVEEDEIETLKELHCHFFLRFGFGIVGGELLDIPEHGIWSFHHGDPEEFRGGPPAFWEFISAKKSNGFILQKLTNQLDGGEIITSGRIAIWHHSYHNHLVRLYQISAQLVKIASRKLHSNGTLETISIAKKGKLYKAPSTLNVLKLYLKLIKNKAYFHYIQLFKGEVWNIGIAKGMVKEKGHTYPKDIDWMPIERKSIYHADPFFGENGTIFFEKYYYQKLKADISKTEYSNGKWSNSVVLFEDSFHLSYPYVVEHQDKQFLIPEQYQSKEIAVYELVNGKLTNKITTLLKGNWVDPTLLFHNGHWWLFASPQTYSNECLHIFYAKDIFGPFTAHALNPVKIDIRSARNGGQPFEADGQLFRPSQNSENGYGSSVKINRIQKLTPYEFEEQCVREIYPNPNSKYKEALHTYSEKNGQYLIDGKYTTFIYASFISQLGRKLKRIVPF